MGWQQLEASRTGYATGLFADFFRFGRGRAHLALVRTIPMPEVEGRIDHMAIDSVGRRLFVAALGSNTVVVVDLDKGTVAHRISGVSEPQGVVYVPGHNVIVASSGGDGSCHLYDAKNWIELATVQFGADADNLRVEPNGDRLYVGYGSGALGALDLQTKRKGPTGSGT